MPVSAFFPSPGAQSLPQYANPSKTSEAYRNKGEIISNEGTSVNPDPLQQRLRSISAAQSLATRGWRFPSSRRYLWDRTATGPCVSIDVKDLVPPVEIPHSFFASQRWLKPRSSEHYQVVAKYSSRGAAGVKITLEQEDLLNSAHTKTGNDKVERSTITCLLLSGQLFEKDGLVDALRPSMLAMDQKGPASLAQLLPMVCALDPTNGSAVLLHVMVMVPNTSFVFTPLLPKRMCDVPLARILQQPLVLNSGGAQTGLASQNGLLTMDQARSVMPLAPDDPQAYSVPLVGVWIKNAPSVQHPLVAACCLRFRYCSTFNDRATQSGGVFLVALFTEFNTSPDYYECDVKEGSSGLQLLPCAFSFNKPMPPQPGPGPDLITPVPDPSMKPIAFQTPLTAVASSSPAAAYAATAALPASSTQYGGRLKTYSEGHVGGVLGGAPPQFQYMPPSPYYQPQATPIKGQAAGATVPAMPFTPDTPPEWKSGGHAAEARSKMDGLPLRSTMVHCDMSSSTTLDRTHLQAAAQPQTFTIQPSTTASQPPAMRLEAPGGAAVSLIMPPGMPSWCVTAQVHTTTTSISAPAGTAPTKDPNPQQTQTTHSQQFTWSGGGCPTPGANPNAVPIPGKDAGNVCSLEKSGGMDGDTRMGQDKDQASNYCKDGMNGNMGKGGMNAYGGNMGDSGVDGYGGSMGKDGMTGYSGNVGGFSKGAENDVSSYKDAKTKDRIGEGMDSRGGWGSNSTSDASVRGDAGYGAAKEIGDTTALQHAPQLGGQFGLPGMNAEKPGLTPEAKVLQGQIQELRRQVQELQQQVAAVAVVAANSNPSSLSQSLESPIPSLATSTASYRPNTSSMHLPYGAMDTHYNNSPLLLDANQGQNGQTPSSSAQFTSDQFLESALPQQASWSSQSPQPYHALSTQNSRPSTPQQATASLTLSTTSYPTYTSQFTPGHQRSQPQLSNLPPGLPIPQQTAPHLMDPRVPSQQLASLPPLPQQRQQQMYQEHQQQHQNPQHSTETQLAQHLTSHLPQENAPPSPWLSAGSHLHQQTHCHSQHTNQATPQTPNGRNPMPLYSSPMLTIPALGRYSQTPQTPRPGGLPLLTPTSYTPASMAQPSPSPYPTSSQVTAQPSPSPYPTSPRVTNTMANQDTPSFPGSNSQLLRSPTYPQHSHPYPSQQLQQQPHQLQSQALAQAHSQQQHMSAPGLPLSGFAPSTPSPCNAHQQCPYTPTPPTTYPSTNPSTPSNAIVPSPLAPLPPVHPPSSSSSQPPSQPSLSQPSWNTSQLGAWQPPTLSTFNQPVTTLHTSSTPVQADQHLYTPPQHAYTYYTQNQHAQQEAQHAHAQYEAQNLQARHSQAQHVQAQDDAQRTQAPHHHMPQAPVDFSSWSASHHSPPETSRPHSAASTPHGRSAHPATLMQPQVQSHHGQSQEQTHMQHTYTDHTNAPSQIEKRHEIPSTHYRNSATASTPGFTRSPSNGNMAPPACADSAAFLPASNDHSIVPVSHSFSVGSQDTSQPHPSATQPYPGTAHPIPSTSHPYSAALQPHPGLPQQIPETTQPHPSTSHPTSTPSQFQPTAPQHQSNVPQPAPCHSQQYAGNPHPYPRASQPAPSSHPPPPELTPSRTPREAMRTTRASCEAIQTHMQQAARPYEAPHMARTPRDRHTQADDVLRTSVSSDKSFDVSALRLSPVPKTIAARCRGVHESFASSESSFRYDGDDDGFSMGSLSARGVDAHLGVTSATSNHLTHTASLPGALDIVRTKYIPISDDSDSDSEEDARLMAKYGLRH